MLYAGFLGEMFTGDEIRRINGLLTRNRSLLGQPQHRRCNSQGRLVPFNDASDTRWLALSIVTWLEDNLIWLRSVPPYTLASDV